jgi:putative tryptophan/tyrosine transport system substrate-binding protein
VRRREFLTYSCGVALCWPLVARGQAPERPRRLGVLMGLAPPDAQQREELVALKEELQKLGWTDGRNTRIYTRWGESDADETWASANQLIDLKPDVIFAHTTSAVSALAQQTRSIPIVFVLVSDPVGNGFVQSWSRPGGNITGFTDFEASMAGKWVELLKKTAPYLTQVALLFNPETAPGGGSVFLDPVEKAAPAFGLNWLAAPARHADEIETIVGALGRHGATGLLVAPDIFTTAYREKIITLTQRYRLPSMYAYRYFAADGGLMSYGMDPVDQCRQAAGYINRILKGAAAGELPIQAPTRFELVINLRTARTLGLEVPQTILAFADAVIE